MFPVMLCGAVLSAWPLQGAVRMADVAARVSEVKKEGEDCLLFRTEQYDVVVLGEPGGNVGAVLVRARREGERAVKMLRQWDKVMGSKRKEWQEYESQDGRAALYYGVAQSLSQEDLVRGSRRDALSFVLTREFEKVVLYRWRDGGLSFRYYHNDVFLFEVTIDLTSVVSSYAEVRVTKDRSVVSWMKSKISGDGFSRKEKSNLRQMIHEFVVCFVGLNEGDMNLDDEDDDDFGRKKRKKQSRRWPGGGLLAVNEQSKVHVTYKDEVYSVGSRGRLKAALNRRVNDGVKYCFPSLSFPQNPAEFKEAEPPEPERKQDVPEPVRKAEKSEPQPTPEPLTPEKARRAYVEWLKGL